MWWQDLSRLQCWRRISQLSPRFSLGLCDRRIRNLFHPDLFHRYDGIHRSGIQPEEDEWQNHRINKGKCKETQNGSIFVMKSFSDHDHRHPDIILVICYCRQWVNKLIIYWLIMYLVVEFYNIKHCWKINTEFSKCNSDSLGWGFSCKRGFNESSFRKSRKHWNLLEKLNQFRSFRAKKVEKMLIHFGSSDSLLEFMKRLESVWFLKWDFPDSVNTRYTSVEKIMTFLELDLRNPSRACPTWSWSWRHSLSSENFSLFKVWKTILSEENSIGRLHGKFTL